MNATIKTLDFGHVQLRNTYTEGEYITQVECADGWVYDIKTDYKTNQPFAVKAFEGFIAE